LVHKQSNNKNRLKKEKKERRVYFCSAEQGPVKNAESFLKIENVYTLVSNH
jgi:hypothetical protein